MTFKSVKRSLLLFPGLILAVLATAGAASAPPLPNPILYMTGTESYQAGGKQWTRYKYDVLNKTDYPAAMFAAAPALPPCGKNTNSSRTWVDFFDLRGKRLYGFCALASLKIFERYGLRSKQGWVPPAT